jgi:hypothetical protein
MPKRWSRYGFQPTRPTFGVELVGQVGGPVRAVAHQGDYAYVGVGLHLVILNVFSPAHLLLIGETEILPNAVLGVAVAGNYAYVADGDDGLVILRFCLSRLYLPLVMCNYPR